MDLSTNAYDVHPSTEFVNGKNMSLCHNNIDTKQKKVKFDATSLVLSRCN